jgi:nitrate reductase delta subunit
MRMEGSLKIGSLKKSPQHFQAADRVKEWTRERFSLPEDAAILVTELTCTVPGCPPLETVVAFWSDHKTRHDFKIFKPIEEIVLDDLPPAWLKMSLVSDDEDGINCSCC